MAPNIQQPNVNNHLNGNNTDEDRNVLIESARITRGNIQDLSIVSSDELLKETADEGSAIENLAEALEKAISEEEYEVAARLRDRIKQLEKKSTPQ